MDTDTKERTRINVDCVRMIVREHKVISLRGLCRYFDIDMTSEDDRPRFLRLSQSLGELVRMWAISVEHHKGVRIYSM